ncbi:nucleoside triphosphate pyrophosphohydrolase [Actibacterium sp. 188UL27-1]|uniref:nucleoside triphosphate pyrophosphohydrolase n=1 Tax=Actibacterium sp. 188UL27-1 TaxID=2786961 RepID=UPI00195A4DB3|nr:nucleoside triphosphate pyrophosphohydrolase [Actibacterium sp. 188UL27-1]MBM7067475.1 nucleoside triphosphate pyrophosphohydrolase [Actibacterium sp. 188UL27-1]
MTDPISDALVHDPSGGLPRLLEIMRRLRDPQTGCPWDIEQTYTTIAPFTIEEAYEVADAVARQAWDELQGELGDLLLQVVYFAQMGEEDERFTFHSIATAIADKMVARHPHVFGDQSRDKSADQQTRDWEAQKASERAAKGEVRTLDGVALGLPSMTRALKLQKRAARVGFDWGETRDVLAKIAEEAAELTEAAETADAHHIEDEMGDLLFVMVNLARHMDVDPEAALRRTNAKFTRRFGSIEDALAADGRTPNDATLQEMDALWDAAKRAERS